MIRSIDEMNCSDELAFAIVAGDYLRAKRRRFPLAGPLGQLGHYMLESLPVGMDQQEFYKQIMSGDNRHTNIRTISYTSIKIPYPMFDWFKEYVEDDYNKIYKDGVKDD